MTSNAKEEENLSIIQQRLQILAPLIQDVNNTCFNLGKFFVTILVAIHGGAIGIVVTSEDESIMDSISYFMIGLIFALIISFIVLFTMNITLSNHSKSIFNHSFDIQRIVKNINMSKKVIYAFFYLFFVLSFSFFFTGVNTISHIKFKINISDAIHAIIRTIIYGIIDTTVMIIDFVNPVLLSICISISLFAFSYKKYKDTIDKDAKVVLKKISNITKSLLSFLWRKISLLYKKTTKYIHKRI